MYGGHCDPVQHRRFQGVQFGPIITDGGFFLFPFAYILGDVISEIYGFKVNRKAVLTTFALSILPRSVTG